MKTVSPLRTPTAVLTGIALTLASSCQHGGGAVIAPSDPELSPATALSLALEEPAVDQRLGPTGSVRILFTAADPLAVASIRLFADADGDPATPADQVELATMPAKEGSMREDLLVPLPTGMPLGEHSIFGTIGDGDRASRTAKAPGRIVIGTDPPIDPPDVVPLALQLTEPAVARSVSRGGTLTVAFAASGPTGSAAVRIVSDADGDVTTTTDQHELASFTTTVGTAETRTVTLEAVPPGTHHLLAIGTTAGGGHAQASAPGLVAVTDSAFAVRDGSSSYEEGRAVAALPDGSLVVAGRFAGSTSFGVWPLVQQLNSLGDDDIFLCRYLTDGTLAWARRAGGPSRSDWPNSIAAAADGTFFVGGYFNGLAALDGGPPNSGLTAYGEDDAFVARYAANGTMLWARHAGSVLHDEVLGTAALADGSCIATGSFAAQATFGSAPNTTVLLVQGSLTSSDGFVAKYGADGTLAWVRAFGGASGDDAGRRVAATADGGCVVTGVFRGTATFGSGANTSTLLAAGGSDVFVARYDAAGTLLWARRGGGAADDEARGITTLTNGSCVVVGGFRGAGTFSDAVQPVAVQAVGGLDAFVARYDASGTLLGVRTVGGVVDDEARGVTTTADGGCLVAGTFQTMAALSGSLPPQSLLGFGSRDLFLARYSAGGGLVWARAAGGTDHDQVFDLAAAPDQSAAITGVFLGAAGFGQGAHRQLLTALGWADVFVVRYNADGDL